MTSLQHLESPTARGQAISLGLPRISVTTREKSVARTVVAIEPYAASRDGGSGAIDGATTQPPD